MYVTPRTLLAIIRLSQALARLSFREQVTQLDVDEAIKLMDFSIRSLRTLKSDSKDSKGKGVNAQRENRRDDRLSEVIRAVRAVFQSTGQSSLKIGDIAKAIAKDRSNGL